MEIIVVEIVKIVVEIFFLVFEVFFLLFIIYGIVVYICFKIEKKSVDFLSFILYVYFLIIFGFIEVLF